MLIGISFSGCRELPNQHIVDDLLLLIAQTTVVGKNTLDVGTRVAADELVIAKNKFPACQVTCAIMANAAFFLVQTVDLDLPFERLYKLADFVGVQIAEVIGKETD
ncbi:MAG: hypothetical protein OEU92_19775 [Alphaproteobacteria bacterium]|nr:hypothetical protein [Alphaproteobacteria bacterium]